jgi:hypothetical protein
MAIYNKTTCDISAIQCGGDPEFKDDLITFGGAATFAAGTLLAIDTSTQKWVKYVKGGVTNGNGIASGVLTYPVTATGAGDVKGRVLVAGKVKKEHLIIDADGNDSNIDNLVILQLRDYNILAVATTQLSVLDP